MLVELISLALAGVHFGVPLAYYRHLKARWLNKPWGIKINEGYRPKVTIVVPTHNEAKLIQKKLDNIYEQEYPRNKLEVIVVDSASTDGTPDLAKKWIEKHQDMDSKLLVEGERKGKSHALNQALRYATGDIIVTADVDATWPSNTLKETLKWLSNPSVGAVSCLKKPVGSSVKGVEEGYRRYYNVLRVAESKAYATPIFHGELAAFKRSLLEKLGGFPTDIGADDSHTATRIALMGYRSIIPEDLWVEELVPKEGYFWWRIRRAQHLIQHFIKILRLRPKTPRGFKNILKTEAFLHLLNPWLLLIAAILLIISALATNSLMAISLLTLGSTLLCIRQYRTWVTTQLILIAAATRNTLTKELVWMKVYK